MVSSGPCSELRGSCNVYGCSLMVVGVSYTSQIHDSDIYILSGVRLTRTFSRSPLPASQSPPSSRHVCRAAHHLTVRRLAAHYSTCCLAACRSTARRSSGRGLATHHLTAYPSAGRCLTTHRSAHFLAARQFAARSSPGRHLTACCSAGCCSAGHPPTSCCPAGGRQRARSQPAM